MGQITVEKNVGGIEGLCVITPAVHGDARGYFMETYNENDMKEAGIDIRFVQDNQSMSTKGVLRGLHFQKQYPQTKLVRAIKGSVFDVAVDLRAGSETYGKWYGIELTEENKKQFLIPRGFAHGFLVLSETAEFCYKCDDFYHPNDEGGMAWNDPEIGVKWPQVKGEYQGTASAEGYELEDGTKLNLKKEQQKVEIIQSPGVVPVTGTVTAGLQTAEILQNPGNEADHTQEEHQEVIKETEGELIVSPLVGTFYAAPAEDAPSFVKVGDKVEAGQVVGIIEAMKLMNEIESECAGTVAEVLVENGEPVEYGQPIFRIV